MPWAETWKRTTTIMLELVSLGSFAIPVAVSLSVGLALGLIMGWQRGRDGPRGSAPTAGREAYRAFSSLLLNTRRPESEWVNMGWWTAQPASPSDGASSASNLGDGGRKDECQFPDAARELACRVLSGLTMDPGAVASLAQLPPLEHAPQLPRRILDLGHGNGDSLLLLSALSPNVLDGVTSLAAQAERAQHRTGGRARVFCADALDWLRSDEGQAEYDAIIAIDSAYHFSSRRGFFEAVYARLAPGGKLLLFDLFAAHPYPASGAPFFAPSSLPSPSPPSLVRRCKHALTLRLTSVPSGNLLPFDVYASELRRAGFGARMADVSEHVFPGFSRFLLSLGRGTEKYWRGGTLLELLPLRMFGEVVDTWASGGAEGTVRGGLVCATKPGSQAHSSNTTSDVF